MVKRVLMVAFHFPPLNMSSGIQRCLRFAQYLPAHDWQPIVLTAHSRAYSGMPSSAHGEVPPNVPVIRAFALDAARHLSVRGRYPRLLGIPDRWWSWWIGAVPAGLALIRKFRPDVLWTTYPIATAHVIGYTLHRLTGVPWVADFRDPMAQDDYPVDPLEHRAFEWIELATLQHCERAVFTAPGALALYAARYPEIARSRLALIENGYDETAFLAAERDQKPLLRDSGPLKLVHSGTVYASERDPRPFFAALAEVHARGQIRRGELQVVLRATGADGYLRGLIEQHRVADIVVLAPPLPYLDALSEMLAADGLLLLQASNCNYQIPAKLYEYLRTRRPVLALTDPHGDTAATLREAGIDTIARLDSEEEIARMLVRFVALVRQRQAPSATVSAVGGASRQQRTAQLGALLDTVVA